MHHSGKGGGGSRKKRQNVTQWEEVHPNKRCHLLKNSGPNLSSTQFSLLCSSWGSNNITVSKNKNTSKWHIKTSSSISWCILSLLLWITHGRGGLRRKLQSVTWGKGFKKCYFASNVLLEWLLKDFFSKFEQFLSEEILKGNFIFCRVWQQYKSQSVTH